MVQKELLIFGILLISIAPAIAGSTPITIESFTSNAVFNTPTPRVDVNTSAPALCRYSTGGVTNYSQMTLQFDFEGSRNNSFVPESNIDEDYSYPVSCVDLDGDNVVNAVATFDIDTTPLWNITIGATGLISVKHDYFTSVNKIYSFTLPKTNVLTSTALPDTYNVTDVLESIVSANPAGPTNNLSILFAYDRISGKWTSYTADGGGNDFGNFTSDAKDYYINLTVPNERIEIN